MISGVCGPHYLAWGTGILGAVRAIADEDVLGLALDGEFDPLAQARSSHDVRHGGKLCLILLCKPQIF